MMLYICSRFIEISLTVQSFKTDTVFLLNITNNQNNSEKKNGGIMVLALYALSDEALYLYQV